MRVAEAVGRMSHRKEETRDLTLSPGEALEEIVTIENFTVHGRKIKRVKHGRFLIEHAKGIQFRQATMTIEGLVKAMAGSPPGKTFV